MMEWTTQHDLEFAEYFPIPEEPAPPLPQEPRQPEPDRGPIWLWWGILFTGCSVFWAMLAVFCWGGNLLPRW